MRQRRGKDAGVGGESKGKERGGEGMECKARVEGGKKGEEG